MLGGALGFIANTLVVVARFIGAAAATIYRAGLFTVVFFGHRAALDLKPCAELFIVFGLTNRAGVVAFAVILTAAIPAIDFAICTTVVLVGDLSTLGAQPPA